MADDWREELLKGRGYMILKNVFPKEEAAACRERILQKAEAASRSAIHDISPRVFSLPCTCFCVKSNLFPNNP